MRFCGFFAGRARGGVIREGFSKAMGVLAAIKLPTLLWLNNSRSWKIKVRGLN